MRVVLMLVGVLFLLLRDVKANGLLSAELKLINDVLLKNYSKDVLPLVNKKIPVTLTFDMSLRRLARVDEKNQIITLQMWVRQEWNNALLRWDPKKHMNISIVNIRKELVWVPDTCLYNTVHDSAIMSEKMDTSVKIDSTGNNSWLAPFLFKSECKINVKFFPFDEQVCELNFGSWTYNGDYVDIRAKRNTFQLMKHYTQNTEWQIVDISVRRKSAYYPCCPRPYPSLIYRFKIRRRTLFSVTNLILPCLGIVLLAFLSFWLPVQCGERVSLVMTSLLAITVFLLYTSNFMPPTSEVIPLVSKFNLACVVEISICLLATIVTVKLHYCTTAMPRWIQLVVNRFLGSILFVGQRVCLTRPSYPPVSGTEVTHGIRQDTRGNSSEGTQQKEMVQHITFDEVEEQQYTDKNASRNENLFVESLKSGLTIMKDKIQQDEASNVVCRQWKAAARILDRLFFILCFGMFLATSIVIFITDRKND